MTLMEIVLLALLGGVLGLDTVSFPQAMLSRPIVGGTLSGAILGDPLHGLLLGATLELFAVETQPYGASRYPEWGSSAVVGAGLFTRHPEALAGALSTSALAALAVAWVGGWTMVQLRRVNAWMARARHEAVSQGSRRSVIGLQLGGLALDFLRGVALTGVALALLLPMQRAALSHWTSDPALSRAVVAGSAAAVSLGAAYKLFHAVPRFPLFFAVGLATGLAVLAVR